MSRSRNVSSGLFFAAHRNYLSVRCVPNSAPCDAPVSVRYREDNLCENNDFGGAGPQPKGMVRYIFSGEGQGYTLVPLAIPTYEIK